VAVAPSLFTKLTYDPQKDLTGVGMLVFGSYILAVHSSCPSIPSRSWWLRQGEPRQTGPGSLGCGQHEPSHGHPAGEALGYRHEVRALQGRRAAIRGVLANESNVIINSALATQSFVVQNQLKGLAVSGIKRLEAVKSLPTFKELNLPAVDSGTWQGVMTTAGTPAPMVARLNAELRKILAMPEMEKKISELGAEVRIGSPEDFTSWMKANVAMWGAVIRDAGIKVEE